MRYIYILSFSLSCRESRAVSFFFTGLVYNLISYAWGIKILIRILLERNVCLIRHKQKNAKKENRARRNSNESTRVQRSERAGSREGSYTPTPYHDSVGVVVVWLGCRGVEANEL